MKKDRDNAPIKVASFYSCEVEKTEVNWHTVEVALSIDNLLRKRLSGKFRRHGIGLKRIAEFSIYIAKSYNRSILFGDPFNDNLTRRFFPFLKDENFIDKITDCINEALDEMKVDGSIRMVRCIENKNHFCNLSEDGPGNTI